VCNGCYVVMCVTVVMCAIVLNACNGLLCLEQCYVCNGTVCGGENGLSNASCYEAAVSATVAAWAHSSCSLGTQQLQLGHTTVAAWAHNSCGFATLHALFTA
jgi:hypothetical protein